MINDKLIKVYGMREADDIRDVEQPEVDMIGFIFYPKSPRCLCELPAYMPDAAKRVGVFVNEDKKEIEILTDRFGLDYIQLHGNRSPEYCHPLRSTGLRLIKAFSIARREDLENTEVYEKSCDYSLSGTKCEQRGGSGNRFDWTMLNSYEGEKPFLLNGGINPYSIPALKELRHPQLAGSDLNSRFEARPGLKEIERLKFSLE